MIRAMRRLGILCVLAVAVAADNASAQTTFPARPVRMVEGLAAQGCIAVGGTPEALTALIRTEYARWSKVVKAGGVKIE